VTDRTLTIPIAAAQRPLGSHLVSDRMVSADSHPVAGGFTFAVGAPSANPTPAEPAEASTAVRVAASATKYVGYIGLTLVIGSSFMLAALWPRRLSRTGPTRLAAIGLLRAAASTLGSLWL
jgi:copper transport protein